MYFSRCQSFSQSEVNTVDGKILIWVKDGESVKNNSVSGLCDFAVEFCKGRVKENS